MRTDLTRSLKTAVRQVMRTDLTRSLKTAVRQVMRTGLTGIPKAMEMPAPGACRVLMEQRLPGRTQQMPQVRNRSRNRFM